MSLAQKEKLYLDSCAAFNADKKQIISDDEFEEVQKKINEYAQTRTHARTQTEIQTRSSHMMNK